MGRHFRNGWPLFAAVALLAAWLTGIGFLGGSVAEARTGDGVKQFRTRTMSTGVSKIPAHSTAGEDVEVYGTVFEGLLRVKAGTSELEPALATDWAVSDDGLTWTFHLRRGVQWHNGYGEFTSRDVKFTWDYHLNPDNGSLWHENAKIVRAVETPDPYTVVFHLHNPFPGFLWSVAGVLPATGFVMSQAAWEDLGREGYEKTPIGTGPFKLKEIVPNERMVLVKNPDWWGGDVPLDEIVFVVIADDVTTALAVRTGDLHSSGFRGIFDPVVAKQYEGDGVRLIARDSWRGWYLAINPLVEPFDDVRVRKALRYAIDYEAITDFVLQGFGVPGTEGLLRPGMTCYNPEVNPPNRYDPDRARALLREAGVRRIDAFFATYTLSNAVKVGEFLEASLEEVGIHLEARPLERGTLVEVRNSPATPAVYIGYPLAPEPDGLLALFLSSGNPPAGLNVSRFDGIDELYVLQRQQVDPEARCELLTAIQKKFAEEVPAIMIYWDRNLWLVRDEVVGYEPTTLNAADPYYLVDLRE